MGLTYLAIGLWFVFVFLDCAFFHPIRNDIQKDSKEYAIELVEQYPTLDIVPQERLREWYDIATKEHENRKAFGDGWIEESSIVMLCTIVGLLLYRVFIYEDEYDCWYDHH